MFGRSAKDVVAQSAASSIDYDDRVVPQRLKVGAATLQCVIHDQQDETRVQN
jgi:hypothetical protein